MTSENESRRNLPHWHDAVAPWREYVTSRVFLASFALSLLYFTVLSFGGTMVTYLLHTGFNSLDVSAMRIGSVAAELSGTWTAPFIMNRIGPIRSGLWFLNWQLCCVAGAAAAYIFSDASSQLAAGSLIVGVTLSRIGLWGFDLSVQFLVQDVSSTMLSAMAHTKNFIYRMSRRTPGHASRRRRWRFRISSRCSRLHPPLCSRAPNSSSIQC